MSCAGLLGLSLYIKWFLSETGVCSEAKKKKWEISWFCKLSFDPLNANISQIMDDRPINHSQTSVI